MSERLRFKVAGLAGIDRQAALAWNRVSDMQDKRDADPDAASQDEIERAALDWFEKSAAAGRAVMRRG